MSLRLLLSCLAMACLVIPPSPARAENPERKGLSSGELLRYSLKDFQKKIKSIKLENQKLSDRNQSLRKRILVFKQEIRRLDDLKIELKERENELKSDHQVDKTQVSIWQMKSENAQLLFDQLKRRKGHLEGFVQEQQERQKRYKSKLAEVQKDLKPLRTRISGSQEPQPDPELQERIENMKGQLREVRANIMDMRKKEATLKKRSSTREVDYNRLSMDNNDLTDRLAGLRAKFKKLVSERQGLREQTQGLKNQINAQIAQQKADIGHWRLYRNNLKDVIDKQRKIEKEIQAHYRDQYKPLHQWLNLLDRQRDLLVAKKEALREVLDSVKLLDQKMRQALLAKQQREDRQANLDQLVAQRKATHGKLTSSQRENPVLVKKTRRLKKDVRRLQARLEKVKDKTQVLQKQVDHKARQELVRLSQKEDQDIKHLQKKIAAATKRVEGFNDRLLLARNVHGTRTNDLTLLKEQVARSDKEQEELKAARALITASPDDAIESIKQDIENLRLQKDLLDSSLQAIKISYDQQETAINEFESEEDQLNEYLLILKNENSGLKDKLKSLELSLDGYLP